MGSQQQRRSIQKRTRGREVRPRDKKSEVVTVDITAAMRRAAGRKKR
jgi:hypothetical protein